MSEAGGDLLAGMRPVAFEPMEEEAHLAFHLLESAGLHPILAYKDDSGVPHPIDPEEPFTLGSGLMLPVTTTFAVYVPESEVPDAQRVLQDAGRALPVTGDALDAGAGQNDGRAGSAGPEGVDQD